MYQNRNSYSHNFATHHRNCIYIENYNTTKYTRICAGSYIFKQLPHEIKKESS